MNFEQLLEPYSERDKEGNKTRTVEGQIKWLVGKGIPRNIIDQSILHVFQELERGLVFDDKDDQTAGHLLDQHLLETAKQIYQADLAKQARELEKFFETFKEDAVKQYLSSQRTSVWKRIKAVFKPL